MRSGPTAVARVRGTIATMPLDTRADGSSDSLTGQMTALAAVQLQYDLAVQAYNHEFTEIQIVTEGKAL
jgi:flagellar basal body rod protein FlgB